MKTRVLFVFEYPPEDEAMARSLIAGLRARRPDLEFASVHGWFREYRPGGLRPHRLGNILWVYLQAAWQVRFGRVDAVIVRSAPPGIQLWTQWWARVRRVPVICWLMDYHPEIEARLLDRRGPEFLAAWLRKIDATLMPGFALVVVLDQAMADLARRRTGGGNVEQHPTWGDARPGGLTPVSYVPGQGGRPLNLAYSGNLGVAHSLAPLAELLRAVRQRHEVNLFVIGTSPAGEGLFRRLGVDLGVSVTIHARVPFASLPGLYEQWHIDAGIVLLKEESAGLVSPSKFSGYIDFGLPIVYFGPAGTSSAEVCVRFRGGFWIPSQPDPAALPAAVMGLLDAGAMVAAATGARAAARHFAACNGDTLAEIMSPRIPAAAGRAAGSVSPLVLQTGEATR